MNLLNVKLIKINIMLHLLGIVLAQAHASHPNCVGQEWISYLGIKCIKMVKTEATFEQASAMCQGLLPFEKLTGQSHPSSILTIESENEKDFIELLMLQEYITTTTWVDYSNVETHSENRFLVESLALNTIDSTDNSALCTKFNADPTSSNDLKFERTPCNQVVSTIICQNLQVLPIEELQRYLMEKAVPPTEETLTLKSEFTNVNARNEELSLTLNSTMAELQALQHQTQQLLTTLDQKMDKIETDFKKRKIQEGVETLRLNRKLEDIKTPLKDHVEKLPLLQSQLDILTVSLAEMVKSTELKSEIESLGKNVNSQIQQLNSSQSKLTLESDAFRTTMLAKGELVGQNMKQLETMISTASGVQTDVAKVQGSVASLKQQDTVFESAISDLRGAHKLLETAVEALQMNNLKVDSKINELEEQDRRFTLEINHLNERSFHTHPHPHRGGRGPRRGRE